MARRYMPREQQLHPLSALAEIGEEYHRLREQRELDEDEREQRSLADALQTLELDELGLREGTAPTRSVPVEDSIFAGERPGLARGQAGPSGLGLSLEALRRMRPRDLVAREPKVVHPPGSFIRGVGFTEVPITDVDLERLRTRGAAGGEAMQLEDERFRQLNEDYYLDTEATPEARERRSAADRQLRLLEAFRGLGAGPGQLDLLEADEGFADELYADLTEEPEGDELEGPMGRHFPNTEAGRTAALEWERLVRDARNEPDGAGGGPNGSREVTRRGIALAAARTVAAIQEQFREMNQAERDRRRDGGDGFQRDLEAALVPFGFNSVQELQQEMRALRISGAEVATPQPAAGEYAGEGEPQVSDDEIDRLLEENPDLTDEEIAELLLGAGA